MNAAWPGAPGAPLLCLDYLAFARRVYGDGSAPWFAAAPLTSLYRQAQQGLQPEVTIFPLLDWLTAWQQAQLGSQPIAPAPRKQLQQTLAQPALIAALAEVSRALAAAVGGRASLALGLAAPERWLQWSGARFAADSALDEADAEEVFVCLAALLHKLPVTAFAGLVAAREIAIAGDATVAFEPLVNVARHLRWKLALASRTADDLPAGFPAVASGSGGSGDDGGWWADESFWQATSNRAAAQGRFVLAIVPPEASAHEVLAALARYRQLQGSVA